MAPNQNNHWVFQRNYFFAQRKRNVPDLVARLPLGMLV